MNFSITQTWWWVELFVRQLTLIVQHKLFDPDHP